MSEVAQNIFYIAIIVVCLVVIGLGTWAYHAIKQKIQDKYNIDIADTTAVKVVKEVFQTYVEALKDENVFDKDAQKTALNLALTKLKDELSNEIIASIERTIAKDDDVSSVEEWLITAIEAAVKTVNDEGE